ncbi:alpha-hydroxy acid oxidase [Silvibacterium acidisoli]|uniref:alpha-hydroxy acid oxidase n=1 Tax=Acidobacteriaceae bacterium ZG23-2 TaxID=2883246 RepID=UPI00406C083B
MLLCLDDYEVTARELLNKAAYEYIASGAADEKTLKANRAAFDEIEILPQVLVDVSSIDTSRTIFGRKHDYPILLAPTGYHRLFHERGEIESVYGANRSNTTLIASTFSTVSFEAMQRASAAPLWFQLYMQRDRGFTRELVRRVTEAGCEAICLTVDLAVNSPRDRELRAGFELPAGMVRENLIDMGRETASAAHSGGVGMLYNQVRAPNVTWKDVEWLRDELTIPLLLKGVLRPEDAETARQLGCDGVIVSNHGGRALDGVPSTMSMLPKIADKVGGSLALFLDGGIRRGTDVFAALAMGADAVMVGRSYLYALAVDGAEGIERMMAILKTEFEMAMGLAGCTALSTIERAMLQMRPAR